MVGKRKRKPYSPHSSTNIAIEQSIINEGLANKSDPFASARAAAHYRSGVATYGEMYSAEAKEVTETVMIGDEEHEVKRTIYINRKRP